MHSQCSCLVVASTHNRLWMAHGVMQQSGTLRPVFVGIGPSVGTSVPMLCNPWHVSCTCASIACICKLCLLPVTRLLYPGSWVPIIIPSLAPAPVPAPLPAPPAPTHAPVPAPALAPAPVPAPPALPLNLPLPWPLPLSLYLPHLPLPLCLPLCLPLP